MVHKGATNSAADALSCYPIWQTPGCRSKIGSGKAELNFYGQLLANFVNRLRDFYSF